MRVRAQSTTAGASGCRVPTASVGCNSSSSPTPSSSWSPPACPRSWRPSPSSRPSSSSIVHVDANVGPLAGRFSFVFFCFFTEVLPLSTLVTVALSTASKSINRRKKNKRRSTSTWTEGRLFVHFTEFSSVFRSFHRVAESSAEERRLFSLFFFTGAIKRKKKQTKEKRRRVYLLVTGFRIRNDALWKTFFFPSGINYLFFIVDFNVEKDKKNERAVQKKRNGQRNRYGIGKTR